MIVRTNKPSAFTLIEVMIAVAVLALLTTAAVLSFASPIHAAQVRQSIDLIRGSDAGARGAATNFNRPVTLHFDFKAGTIRREQGGAVISQVALPSLVRMNAVQIANRGVDAQDASISFSQLGISPSYAVEMVAGRDRPFWLVFAGLGGQMVRVDDAIQMQKVLSPRS